MSTGNDDVATDQQLAIVAAPDMSQGPAALRIGPPRHKYVYHRLNDDTWLCERGSDWAVGGEKLVLKRAHGRWTAYDCVTPSDGGIPVFDTEENAIAEGYHEWRTNHNRSLVAPDWRATGLSCMTTILE